MFVQNDQGWTDIYMNQPCQKYKDLHPEKKLCATKRKKKSNKLINSAWQIADENDVYDRITEDNSEKNK